MTYAKPLLIVLVARSNSKASDYPNATGHDDGREEHMPLFETSSLFILFYAYQKYTGDASWTKQYSSKPTFSSHERGLGHLI